MTRQSRHPRPPVGVQAREYYTALLRPVFEERKFILAGGPAASLGRKAHALAALGADRPFLLAFGEGSGEVPGPGNRRTACV